MENGKTKDVEHLGVKLTDMKTSLLSDCFGITESRWDELTDRISELDAREGTKIADTLADVITEAADANEVYAIGYMVGHLVGLNKGRVVGMMDSLRTLTGGGL